jgi:predicted TIM-barrel fold metal-dependent hydrolase
MDDNVTGAEFLRDLQVDDDVRRKVAGENALRLFGDKIPRR